MAIYRPQEPTRDFVKATRSWVRDPALSAKAKGLLSYISSHSPTYELSFEQIVAEMRDDERSVRSGIKELEAGGYLRRWRRRDPSGKLGGYDWQVIDFPDVFAGRDQAAKTQPSSEQGDRTESAGGDHTAKQQGGRDQGRRGVSADRNHTAKQQGGRDQQEQGISAGGDHTAERRTKETKETREGDKEETTELSGPTSRRFAPSGGGDTHETDDDADPMDDDLTDKRSKDRALFRQLTGGKLKSDGSKWADGVYTSDAVYTALRKRKPPIVWPGSFLEFLEGRNQAGGIEDWLLSEGLEPA